MRRSDEEVVSLCPGDIFTTELQPEYYDIAYVGHVLYWLPENKVSEVLERVHLAIGSGGAVVVATPMPDEKREESKDLTSGFYHFLASGGDYYTFSEYESFLVSAGFSDVALPLDSVVVAKKAI